MKKRGGKVPICCLGTRRNWFPRGNLRWVFLYYGQLSLLLRETTWLPKKAAGRSHGPKIGSGRGPARGKKPLARKGSMRHFSSLIKACLRPQQQKETASEDRKQFQSG